MSSRAEILSLINRYSLALDSGDLDGFLDLFADAVWTFDEGEPNRGREELFKNVVSRVIIYDDGTPRTRHLSTNIELEIDEDAGRAKCQRYVMVYQQTDGFPLQAIYSGRYLDEFTRQDGSWQYSSCTIRDPFFGDVSRHIR